jgi:hypothetical protein
MGGGGLGADSGAPPAFRTAGSYHGGGARELVLQILDFHEGPQAREHLDAMRRDRHVSPAVVDGLIALEPLVKAELARRRPAQAAPCGQDTGEDHDP